MTGLLFLGLSLVFGIKHGIGEIRPEIDVGVDVTLEQFLAGRISRAGQEFLKSAKGVLVFPSVVKAGFIVGGAYGEGAMRAVGARRPLIITIRQRPPGVGWPGPSQYGL